MQSSNGYIFKLLSGRTRFIGDDDVVYDWVLGSWRRACTLPASIDGRTCTLRSLRETGRPFYRARMIRHGK